MLRLWIPNLFLGLTGAQTVLTVHTEREDKSSGRFFQLFPVHSGLNYNLMCEKENHLGMQRLVSSLTVKQRTLPSRDAHCLKMRTER